MNCTLILRVILLYAIPQAYAMDKREAAQALLALQSQQNSQGQRRTILPSPPCFVLTTIQQSCKKKLFQMPTAQVLQERLIDYRYFLNHSGLVARIAGKQLTAIQIEQAFQESLGLYLTFITHQGWSEILIEGQKLYNPGALPLLFAEHPEGLNILIVSGLYKPKE